jgi:glucose-6-phosphate isomerase
MADLTTSGAARKLLVRDIESELSKALGRLKEKAADPFHLLNFMLPPPPVMRKCAATAARLDSFSEKLVVCGIGGSSLAAKLFGTIGTKNSLLFFEGLDPRHAKDKLNSIDFSHSSLNLVSKSGNSLETLTNAALLLVGIRRMAARDWKKRVVLTASPLEGRLQKWAADEKVTILELPVEVGGRFSAFTPVGLLPALFVGLDPDKILRGIRAGLKSGLCGNLTENPSAGLAAMILKTGQLDLGNIVLWGYGRTEHAFALWTQQLWAESLGKMRGDDRFGVTPVVLMGSEDQHSLLQLLVEGPKRHSVLFLTDECAGVKLPVQARKFAGFGGSAKVLGDVQRALIEGTSKSLLKAGLPCAEFSLGKADEKELSEAMTIFIIATLLAAEVQGINPFGQPGVEEGKRITKALLT